MTNIQSKAGQSLFDISIEHSGSIDSLMDIATANNMSITSHIATNSNININIVSNKKVIAFFASKTHKPASDTIDSNEGVDYWALENNFEIQ